MQDNLVKYILGRSKRTILLPFYKYIYNLKKSLNLKVVFSKALVHISSMLKGFLSLRPQKETDYFYIGRLGIYKKLVVIFLLLICLLPVAYLEFFSSPPSSAQEDSLKYEFRYNDPELEAFTGTAKILSANGHLVYEGSVEKGKCSGKGTLYDLDGNLLYSGDFKDNQYVGIGKLYYPSGKLKYDGAFDANQYSGSGILYGLNGSLLYSGDFTKDLKEGKGKLYDVNSALLYEGGFKGDQYDGSGKLYYSDGKLKYEGTFAENLYNGAGTLYNTNGTVQYAGSFAKGKKQGSGKLYDETGKKLLYEGNFAEDGYSDQGSVYADNGLALYTGSFKNGLYSGEGTLFAPGTARMKYKGGFKNGAYEGIGTLYSDAGREKFTGQFLKGTVDYVYFLNLPAADLSKHFYSPSVTDSFDLNKCLTFEDMGVTFVVEGTETTAQEQKPPATEGQEPKQPAAGDQKQAATPQDQPAPKISSVVVYDGTLLPDFQEQGSEADTGKLLNSPVYEGYTYLLGEDGIALKEMALNGKLEKDGWLYSAAMSPGSAANGMQLYVKRYSYLGFSLSLFYDQKDGKFLYYKWNAD